MVCNGLRGIHGRRVENKQKDDGAILIINIARREDTTMAKYYDGCPWCGRRD